MNFLSKNSLLKYTIIKINIKRFIFRLDLGPGGSFGGRKEANETLNHQPVIFVHGVSNTAGDMMKKAALDFM
jgi:hypothetical protein